jgi:hypothetical protein
MLEEKDISFTNEGVNVWLSSLTSLPEGVKFNNGGNVWLSSLTSLPGGVEFNNRGDVHLSSLTFLPEDVEFNNTGNVHLSLLTSLPEGVEFNNGGNVWLSSLTSLPEGVEFNNGGDIYLRSKIIYKSTPYIKRYNIEIKRGHIIFYKRVSSGFKTQEGNKNETTWSIGKTLTHPAWDPESGECGEGKYHACVKAHWCDIFRNRKGDRYIAVKVNVKDIFEWKDNPTYPQKIGFRKGKVMAETDRMGNYLNMNK